MQDLKLDTERFLIRPDGGDTDRDRDAVRLIESCRFDVRDVDSDGDGPLIDVLIRGTPTVISAMKSAETAGRIENALRRVSTHRVRMLQWVETSESSTTGPGSGAGDGSGATTGIARAPSGQPPQPHRDSQGHGSSQSPQQPGDRQVNPPPHPRR